MSILKLGASIVSVGVIAITTFFALNLGNEKQIIDNNNKEASYSTTEEKVVYDKLSEVDITSPDEKDSLIPANATFNLKFTNDVSKEYVENTFSIKPTKNFEVSKINSKEYQISAKLDEDELYNIVEKTTNGTKKWAFQTEKVFKVEYTYPEDGSYLDENGTFEIRFNSEVAKDVKIEDYITITPNIAGTWEKNRLYYHFEPKEKLKIASTYTVKINKGLKDVDGNILKDDYEFSFYISNQDDMYARLSLLNNYMPNTDVNFSLYLSLDMNNNLSVEEAKLKIINLGSKEEFISAIKELSNNEKLNQYYDSKTFKEVVNKDLKDFIKSKFNEAKSKKMYWYSEEVLLDETFNFKEEGYYLAILNLNSNLSYALFQVNSTSATVSYLSNDDLFALYKGKDGNNNSVNVNVNGNTIGKTDSNGMLYKKEFSKTTENLEKKNYIEFENGTTPYIFDLSDIVYSSSNVYNSAKYYSNTNSLVNGYIYIDRNTYKLGETIHYWGYIKNRQSEKIDPNLKIYSNYDDELLNIPLKLSETGTFEGEYELSDVNMDSYISLRLYDGEKSVAYQSARIKNYELKQYNITIVPESTKYVVGDNVIIDITANTYDGIPLANQKFTYTFNDTNSSVTTDENGNARISFVANIKNKRNTIYPEYTNIRITNSIIDGEVEHIGLQIYPYKNSAEANGKFIIDENKYYLNFKEYKSLDSKISANDSLKVNANAYKLVKEKRGTEYNKYTKKMEEIFEYKEYKASEFNKTFTVEMKDGKGTIEIEKFNKDNNYFYKFETYIITDDGRNLALDSYYDGGRYVPKYKTINDIIEYTDIEYVAPVIEQDITYNLTYDYNENLKVNDEVYFYLEDDYGKRLNDYSKFEFYTIVYYVNGYKIVVNKGEQPHFTYEKDFGANVTTQTICYDSQKTYVPNGRYSYYRSSSSIRLCEKELSLDLELEFDKEIYEPGDEIAVKIKVKDNGKPVKAGVNISAVDTAFIDKNGTVPTDIIYSLYNELNISALNTNNINTTRGFGLMDSAVSKNAAAVTEESAMALDMGAEQESSRDDLRTTAFFESIVTDENGEATIKINLPDNITEWTIVTHAFSNNFKAKVETQNIKVSKDFYVALNHKDFYLTGEKFAFDIKSFSKIYLNKDVDFLVEILDSNNNIIESSKVNSKTQKVESYKVKNSIDKKGTYKIRLTGSVDNIKDTLVDKFEVVESLLDTTQSEDIVLNKGDKITIVSPKGYIYFLNEDVKKLLPTLNSLMSLYSNDRVDTQIISKEASRIYKNLCYEKEFDYQKSNSNLDIFRLTKNSSNDYRLALKILATKAISNYKEDTIEKIEVGLGKMAALWAKANTNQITLKELREEKEELIANTSNYKIEDSLYLALAFADIGSYDEAEEIYNKIKDQIKENNSNEFELKVILAIKLNLDERHDLYNKYLLDEEEMLPEDYNFIKLYYIQNELSKNFKKAEARLMIDGKEDTIEIKNVGFTRKVISKNSDIEFISNTGNLSYMLEQYKPVDFDSIERKGYIISKKYSKENPKLGDIVEVTIAIDNKKLYENGYKYYCNIEDAIPNNYTYIEFDYSKSNGYLRKQNGQKLSFSIWNTYDPKYNSDKVTSYIKYKVRMTNDGEKLEPGTIALQKTKIIDKLK